MALQHLSHERRLGILNSNMKTSFRKHPGFASKVLKYYMMDFS